MRKPVKKTFCFRLPKTLMEDFKKYCSKNNLTMSGELESLIEKMNKGGSKNKANK